MVSKFDILHVIRDRDHFIRSQIQTNVQIQRIQHIQWNPLSLHAAVGVVCKRIDNIRASFKNIYSVARASMNKKSL